MVRAYYPIISINESMSIKYEYDTEKMLCCKG